MNKTDVKEIFLIICGCFLMAVSLNLFLQPHNIVIGGATGIAVIAANASLRLTGFEIPLWLTNLLVNIPLFAIGIPIFGMKFLKKTLFAAAFLSAAIFITSMLPPIETDIVIAVIFGGALTGVGLGIVFMCRTTTGGSDLAASILHKYFPYISVARIMLLIDVAIIAAGYFEFGSYAVLYAMLCVYIISRVIDTLLEGLGFAKAAFIVTDNFDKIANNLIKELDRGATIIDAQGGYTGSMKKIVLCVVSKKEIIRLKQIVAQADIKAFVIVADVREALGEGFGKI